MCHVSTAGSVEIIRWAKSKGWRVTAEVTPHHLFLTEDLVADYDPVYKVNPPLRTAADVAALRAGLADGTIDCVATDHAPHPAEDKETEWAVAAFGMTGLETALRVVHAAMVETGLLGWDGVADRMSARPAAIGRLDGPPPPSRRRSRPGTARRWPPARPLTWCCTTRRPAPRSTRRSMPRAAATPRSPALTCPARSSRRSCAARPTVLDGKLAR